MATPREKFQTLLRKLFQFDCADLDFGIYPRRFEGKL
jgi:adenine-specific DNA-methyltransferase